ncbi:NAD-dependent epimerase/dehydratase family protein [bacterium]|nr:NAD-dependent epimerase/dehydratase family protein [bacterium]
MNILITGATGFIGQGVVNLLTNNGHNVVAIVRKGRTLEPNKMVKFVECEIDTISEDIYLKFGKVDILIDLAWSKLDDYSSLHHFEIDLPMHYAFIKSLVRLGLKSVVVTGTCFEYGLQSGQLSEDMHVDPTTSYGYAKDSLRRQLVILQDNFNFNLTWLRLFYSYGGRKNGHDLYSQLEHAIVSRKTVFKMSKGDQVRDYISYKELFGSIVKLSLINANLGIVNVCSGKPIAIKDLIGKWLIKNNWNIDLDLGFYQYSNCESFCFWGDAQKLKSILKSYLL